jgi:chromosomal replication initiation ATPase DnaA
MSQETNNITKVLSELNKTIQVIGTEKLIEILKISRENDTDLDDDTIIKSRMIIQIVCDEFQIKYDDFFSRMRKNNRRYAIGITTTLLKDILKLDVADISFLLKKPNNLISIYSNEVLELNPKHKSDIVIIEKIENINTKLKNINYGN